MRREGRKIAGVDEDEYIRSQTRLQRLQKLFPEDAVQSLASEVLHRVSGKAGNSGIERPSAAQIERLCRALIEDDDRAGADFVIGLRSAGASLEAIYLSYLAEAARCLGAWWNEDRISLSDVTLGTSRMYAILRALRRENPNTTEADKFALFAAVPGENHTLGIRMAADLFRKDGWHIELRLGVTHDELIADIMDSDPPLLGLSAAGHHSLAALTRLIVAVRLSSPDLLILVGGEFVSGAGDAATLLDVDGLASNIDEARAQLDTLWTRYRGSKGER